MITPAGTYKLESNQTNLTTEQAEDLAAQISEHAIPTPTHIRLDAKKGTGTVFYDDTRHDRVFPDDGGPVAVQVDITGGCDEWPPGSMGTGSIVISGRAKDGEKIRTLLFRDAHGHHLNESGLPDDAYFEYDSNPESDNEPPSPMRDQQFKRYKGSDLNNTESSRVPGWPAHLRALAESPPFQPSTGSNESQKSQNSSGSDRSEEIQPAAEEDQSQGNLYWRN